MEELKLGQKIHNYTLEKNISSNSFESVWTAEHTITRLKVITKIISKGSLPDNQTQLLFSRTVHFLKCLEHPFISELFEVFETDTFHILVFEFASGGNIFNYIIIHGRIAEPIARLYFIQLLSVIDLLHTQLKSAHNEMNFKNVMLDDFDNIRVIGFGFSHQFLSFDEQTQVSPEIATFTAPEVVKGEPYSMASDIWGAGLILFLMVTGELPFYDTDYGKVIQKVVFSELKYPLFLSNSVLDLLKKMIVKNPGKRPNISSILKHPWIIESSYETLMPDYIFSSLKGTSKHDEEILVKMNSYGFETEKVLNDLEKNEFGAASGVYRSFFKQKMSEFVCDEMNRMIGLLKIVSPLKKSTSTSKVSLESQQKKKTFPFGHRELKQQTRVKRSTPNFN